MNVYQKLNLAREKFHQSEIKKSGHNKFAGYNYFELGDFVIPALKIFKEVGLTSVISFKQDDASMSIINCDKPDEVITINSPMSEAQLKGCHPVQNLGAVETYIRRYLWVAALEIVEHDALDATTGSSVVETKEAPKPKDTPKDKTVEGISITSEEQKIPSSPDDQKMFVDSMIDWADSCETAESLKKLWKVNQKTIDSLKSGNKEQYDRLQSIFSELKKNFSTEEK
jgi:hypothetical protein